MTFCTCFVRYSSKGSDMETIDTKSDVLLIDDAKVLALADKQAKKLVFVPLASLEDHPYQPRRELSVDKIVGDIARAGLFLPQFPILVFAKGKMETVLENGRKILKSKTPLHIGQGHRRTAGGRFILAMAEKTPEEKATGSDYTWKQLADRAFPDGLIPVDVRFDVDLYEQIQTVNDHGRMKSEKPLTFFEAVSNVLRLITDDAKYTEEQIVDLAGLGSRDLVQQAKRLRVMPAEVRKAFQAGTLKQGSLKALYNAGKKDAAGRRGGFVATGPEFGKVLAEQKERAAGNKPAGHMTASEINDHMNVLKAECPALDDIFAALFDGKISDKGTSNIDLAVSAAQALQKRLEKIK